MDIRDIKESVPIEIVREGKILHEIFSLQRGLIDKYIKIEKMPEYPVDIDIKENQIFLKDLIARIGEELSEGFESYQAMVEYYDYNIEQRGEDKPEEVDLIPHLQNFNEELADALHFLIELFIVCNIDADDIVVYYDKLLDELGIDAIKFESDPMSTIMGYARHCNVQAGLYNTVEYSGPRVIHNNDLKDEFLRGGRTLSPDVMREQKCQLWDTMHQFNLARNMLKNKPWKQTEMRTDENRFQHQLMEGLLHFMRYLDFIGMTEQSIFTIYWKKNKINHFRIKSNY